TVKFHGLPCLLSGAVVNSQLSIVNGPSSIDGINLRWTIDNGQRTSSDFAKGVGQVVEQVAGDEADYALVVAGQVAGEAVAVDAQLGSRERRQAVAQERGDDAGKHVAGAAGRHARVAGRVLINLLAIRNDGALALENDDQSMIGGETDR